MTAYLRMLSTRFLNLAIPAAGAFVGMLLVSMLYLRLQDVWVFMRTWIIIVGVLSFAISAVLLTVWGKKHRAISVVSWKSMIANFVLGLSIGLLVASAIR
jgi:hypothetical protein